MAGKSPISPVWGQILWQFSVCFQVFHFIPIITRRISIMSIIIGIDTVTTPSKQRIVHFRQDLSATENTNPTPAKDS